MIIHISHFVKKACTQKLMFNKINKFYCIFKDNQVKVSFNFFFLQQVYDDEEYNDTSIFWGHCLVLDEFTSKFLHHCCFTINENITLEKVQRKDNMSWYYYKNNFDLVDTLKVLQENLGVPKPPFEE